MRWRHGLLVVDDGTIIAVAAHRRHARFNAELLQAFLVLPEHRGKGLAAVALECALRSIHSSLRYAWHTYFASFLVCMTSPGLDGRSLRG